MPTIYGIRKDVGFAQSAWEANLARVLRFVGRDILTHQEMRLSDDSLYEIDFLTLDRRGRMVGYEIMAHPLENPKGWDKLERAILEYPNIVFRVVDVKYYRRLEKHFAAIIADDDRFCGWENNRDNLKNNPQKYTEETLS